LENVASGVAYTFEVLADKTFTEMEVEKSSWNNITMIKIPRHTC
jgi:hypothetical protein